MTNQLGADGPSVLPADPRGGARTHHNCARSPALGSAPSQLCPSAPNDRPAAIHLRIHSVGQPPSGTMHAVEFAIARLPEQQATSACDAAVAHLGTRLNPGRVLNLSTTSRARSSADRASASGAEGRGFESRRARQSPSNATPGTLPGDSRRWARPGRVFRARCGRDRQDDAPVQRGEPGRGARLPPARVARASLWARVGEPSPPGSRIRRVPHRSGRHRVPQLP